MPGYTGKSSTSRGIVRHPVSGRIVTRTRGKGRVKFEIGPRKARAHADKIAIPRDVIDQGAYELTKMINVPTKRASRRETDTAEVSEAQPGVDQFTNSVLSALKGILGARLGTLAAADIDITSLGTPTDVAEWLASALPASHPFDEIAGPFYDLDGVARRLQISRERVLERVEDNRLLGCPTAEETLVFPLFQFNPDGSSVAGLQRVLDMMAKGTADRWQIALWMSTPIEQLNDHTPAQALQQGDTKIVEELAEQTATRWRH